MHQLLQRNLPWNSQRGLGLQRRDSAKCPLYLLDSKRRDWELLIGCFAFFVLEALLSSSWGPCGGPPIHTHTHTHSLGRGRPFPTCLSSLASEAILAVASSCWELLSVSSWTFTLKGLLFPVQSRLRSQQVQALEGATRGRQQLSEPEHPAFPELTEPPAALEVAP